MSRFEYWRNEESGSVWAIEFDEERVVGYCGPFALEEVHPDRLGTLTYAADPGELDYIEAHRTAFHQVTEFLVRPWEIVDAGMGIGEV